MGWAEGMTVSITELSKLDRQHIQQLIESEGGRSVFGCRLVVDKLLINNNIRCIENQMQLLSRIITPLHSSHRA